MDGISTIASPLMWAGFTGFVLAMLALDLGVFHRKAHEVSMREATAWSVVWVGLAMVFNALLWNSWGEARGMEFLTGYLIEKALAVDNIFIFLMVFAAFSVPKVLQHKVLFWGILGALLMRAVFIFAGAALLAQFHWILYVFGGFLVVTAFKMLRTEESEFDPGKNVLYRLLRRLMPATDEYHGGRFTVRIDGRLHATPLLAVLVCIEATDLVFAVDSIPAIFAVTQDPFIVYTSNIFAILGLRSMFFLLAGAVGKFHYLKPALSGVLAFVGTKMLLLDFVKIPIGVSLGAVAAILVTGIVASLLWPARDGEKPVNEAAKLPGPSPA